MLSDCFASLRHLNPKQANPLDAATKRILELNNKNKKKTQHTQENNTNYRSTVSNKNIEVTKSKRRGGGCRKTRTKVILTKAKHCKEK